MPGKNILMFYKNEKQFDQDPFAHKGAKRSVYYDFFRQGTERGYNMYLIRGLSKHLGQTAFSSPMKFDGANFVITKDVVEMDAVLDRSGGLDFPPAELDNKVLDNRDFKLICWDKNLMYGVLKNYMPLSVSVCDAHDLRRKVSNFSSDNKVVLKPSRGLKGQDVVIDYPENIIHAPLKEGETYILQSFVDTSTGIEGVVQGVHDLRMIVVNGEILFASVRRPADNSLVANTSQGGQAQEVPIEIIPRYVMYVAEAIRETVDSEYNRPLYSVDFGIADERPYLYEINDTIEFPSEQLPSAGAFVSKLLDRLIEMAERH